MKPGDLIEVWGSAGSGSAAWMYTYDPYGVTTVSRGTIGVVIAVSGGRTAFGAGYIEVLLSGDRLGFIGKETLRVIA
jgi:hypothetical protein